MTPLVAKSTVDEIRARFDADVDRFSSLETGQQATIDSPLVLELVAASCATHLHSGDTLLDIGCGAGNFTLRVLQDTPGLHCLLADLSKPMLTRAEERIGGSTTATAASVRTWAGDVRDLVLPAESVDAILAGAVLHHLRDDADWHAVFTRLHTWLKPGGRVYVADFVRFDDPALQELMWARYGRYLESLGGAPYREMVIAYIEKEDSPRSLPFQLDLLRQVGFRAYEVLHRHSVFACYVGIR